MPKSKWLRKVDAETPISKAAKQALDSRFEVVAHYFPQAAKAWKDDVEYVHQLRTASRRFTAATDFFEPVLPPKRSKRLSKLVKKARKSAGDARDLDVYLAKFVISPEWSHAEDHPAVRFAETSLEPLDSQQLDPQQLQILRNFMKKARKKAQKPIEKAWQKAKDKDWAKQAKQVFKRIRWRGRGSERTFGEIAPELLKPLVERFFTTALTTELSPNSLHQLRIEGKRVRYAMELAAAVFEKSFRKQLYPNFEEVQTALGNINDHASAQALFKSWYEQAESVDLRGALDLAIQEELRMYEQEVEEFRQWWTKVKVAELRGMFQEYLPPM
ncbi:MAG: CHAD domain-containing protein [Pirellulaceae bacterium]